MDKLNQQKFIRLSAVGFFLVAAALRLSLLYRSLQYDELWSWQFFAPLGLKSILFDLSLPNNHPLNTLGIKLITAVTDDIFLIRTLPFICGTLLPFPLYFAVSTWCNDKRTGFLSAVLAAFSAPAIVYSALARGYIIQAFFFVLTAAGFACFSSKHVDKHAKNGFFLIIAGGIGTVLSVPTGIVFLAALLLAVWLHSEKQKPHKLLLYSLIAGAIISVLYYSKIYSSLTAAQKWSVGGNYFYGCGQILFHTSAGCIVATLAALVAAPKKSAPLLAILVIVLLSGAFTGLGPDRTYIIFSIVFSALCAIAVTEFYGRKVWGKLFAAVLLLLFAAGQIYNVKNFILPDWKMADIRNSATTVAVYPANSSYPLLWNLGTEFLADYQNSVGKSYLDTVKVYADNGVFNGMDSSFGEKQIKTNLKGAPGYDKVLGVFHTYRLEPCSSAAPDGSCYLVAYPKESFPVTAPENALRLNPHFESSVDKQGRCALYFTEKYPESLSGANIFLIKGI